MVGVVSTAFPNDLGEGGVHLVEQGGLAGVGQTQDEDVERLIAFEELVPD